MEVLNIVLNDASAFDRAVHGSPECPALSEGADLELITKDGAMQTSTDGSGKKRAGAVLTFTVEVDGKRRRAQAVISVRNLVLALRVLDARYDDGVARATV